MPLFELWLLSDRCSRSVRLLTWLLSAALVGCLIGCCISAEIKGFLVWSFFVDLLITGWNNAMVEGRHGANLLTSFCVAKWVTRFVFSDDAFSCFSYRQGGVSNHAGTFVSIGFDGSLFFMDCDVLMLLIVQHHTT